MEEHGGNGYARRYSSSWAGHSAGGGAGNPGGSVSQAGTSGSAGENGTGGLLIVYANSINNKGTVTSQGCSGGYRTCWRR